MAALLSRSFDSDLLAIRRRPRFSPGLTHPVTGARPVFSLVLALSFCPSSARSLPFDVPVIADADDGEEVDSSIWNPDASPLTVGRCADGSLHEVALRYLVPQLSAGDSVLFARLRFCSAGSELTDSLTWAISGAAEAGGYRISQDHRPSLIVHTNAQVGTTTREPWGTGDGNTLFYYSDDISSVINEILAVPGWHGDSSAVVLFLAGSSPVGPAPNLVRFSGFGEGDWSATLQLCRSLDEAFDCHERLGRPTNGSIVLRFRPLIAMEVYVEYGTGGVCWETSRSIAAAGVSSDIELAGLSADTEYTCRLRFRRAGRDEEFHGGVDHRFRTQRPPGSSFTFTATADEHTWSCYQYEPQPQGCELLYRRALGNVADDDPDFHFSLGDFAMSVFVKTMSDARDRYLLQRRLLDQYLPSTPCYLTLGNHEGELGWLRVAGDSAVVRAERARLEMIPNPEPDLFYAGCPDSAWSGGGLRQSYYAWEWGDALFVVLDPFWSTTVKPHNNPDGLGGGWNWTLGLQQYEWLFDVLRGSSQRWKIVLLHHLTGGVDYGNDSYGRGGIEVVKWQVAHRPTFEWGGQDEFGQNVFSTHRPGWTHGPIHRMLLDSGVNLVIHGHDHFCAFQDVDGISYVLCPQPGDDAYTYGTRAYGGYEHGVLLPNSGHLRFQVSPDNLVVDYIRAYLDGDGPNGQLEYRYTVMGSAGAGAGSAGHPSLRIMPNPVSGGSARIWLASGSALDPDRGNGEDDRGGPVVPHLDGRPGNSPVLRVFDSQGRLHVTLRGVPEGGVDWDLRGANGQPIPSGVYWCRASCGGRDVSRRFLVLR